MPFVTRDLPPAIRESVTGASTGDYRFAAQSDDGPYYVIWVRNVIPSATQPT